jgi:tetratricopeptide (TPR) repeat protein
MNTPLPLKCFFRGRLELGSEKTFEKVKTHYLNRIETMYRTDVFFTIENDFREEEFAIEFSRDTMQLSEKVYKKSMDLLRELAQYGLAGRIKGWAIDSGRIIGEDIIFPDNTKDVVVALKEAYELSQEPGNENLAIKKITESLDIFDRNPLAYDRRGFISYQLGKFTDAIIDFEKSIALFKDNPEPYYGLGRCYFELQDWAKAKEGFSTVVKVSLPREPIYHTSRLFLGMTLYKLGEHDAAMIELDAFLKRKHDSTEHNSKKEYLAHKFLGKIYIKRGNDPKSLEHFNLAYLLGQKYDKSLKKPEPPPPGNGKLISEAAIAPKSRKRVAQPG